MNKRQWYARMRKAGMQSRQALDAAKALAEWQDLESEGVVRLIAEPDYDITLEDAAGERDPHTSDRTWQEYLAMIADRGIYGVVGQYHLQAGSPWVTADSIWGCAGYVDPLDPRENWYVPDILQETIDQYHEVHNRALCKVQTERTLHRLNNLYGRGDITRICWDCMVVTRHGQYFTDTRPFRVSDNGRVTFIGHTVKQNYGER